MIKLNKITDTLEVKCLTCGYSALTYKRTYANSEIRVHQSAYKGHNLILRHIIEYEVLE